MKMASMFYEEYGRPMIEQQFKNYKQYIACGLVGQGSECFLLDDDISTDHDYAPGFCIFIPEYLRDEIGNKLQVAYNLLPINTFLIAHKDLFNLNLRDVFMTGAREHRIGLHSIEEFYFEHTGITYAPHTISDWMSTKQMFIYEACNGEVFDDYYGKFSEIRNVWKNYYPIDILKKKVSANCAMAGKTGQFNYKREITRHDKYGAYSCCVEFIKKISAVLYLLNNQYMPYYKWVFRGMQNFTICKDAVDLLYQLTQLNENEFKYKLDLIERISSIIICELKYRDWSNGSSDYLLDHAKIMLNSINDKELSSMNVFIGED